MSDAKVRRNINEIEEIATSSKQLHHDVSKEQDTKDNDLSENEIDDVSEDDNDKNQKKLYQKEWYKKNKEKIKKSYDPAKRKEKYLMDKEDKAKLKEKINSGKFNVAKEDDKTLGLFCRRIKEKNYKKKWYQKNADNVNDPEKRKQKYLKEKASKAEVVKKLQEADDSDDFEDEKVQNFLDNREKKNDYMKEYYKKNSEKIKSSYDPEKRKQKYLKEKASKAEVVKKLQEADDSDDFEDEKVQTFLENREKKNACMKEYYQKNAGKIKTKYDPKKRKASHQKEKNAKEKTSQKILDADPDECGDDFYEDGAVDKFFHQRDQKKANNKRLYAENAEKMKKNYDPAKRRAKYLKEKETRAKILKRMNDETPEESTEVVESLKFLKREEKQKLYRKKWYKENAEKVKKTQAEKYDPKKRQIQHHKNKERLEVLEKEYWKKEGEKYNFERNQERVTDARRKNKERWEEAKNYICYRCDSCKRIKDLELPQVKEAIKEIEANADQLYEKFENEIDEIVENGKEMTTKASYKTLFMNLYLEYPPNIGKQLWRIGPKGNLINMSEDTWRFWKEDGWVLPENGTEGLIKIGLEPNRFGKIYHLAKEQDNDKVDLFGCKECPEDDLYKWERIPGRKGYWFTLKNKNNGKNLTCQPSGLVTYDDETYYENNLVHSWEDMRKKHCEIMKDIAMKIGELYDCTHESTKWKFWTCDTHYWCQLCK